MNTQKIILGGLVIAFLGSAMIYDQVYGPCWNKELCERHEPTIPTAEQNEDALRELEEIRKEVKELEESLERLDDLIEQYQRGTLKSA